MRARSVFFVASSAAAVVVGGCFPSRLVRDDEKPTQLDEGYVAIGVDVEAPKTLSTTFCQDGNVQRCFSTPAATSTSPYAVVAVPPGNYCLTQLLVQDGAGSLDMLLERSHMRCFVVAAHVVHYPGHVTVGLRPEQFSSTGVSMRFVMRETAQAELAAQLPALATLPLETPTTTAAPPDTMMQMR